MMNKEENIKKTIPSKLETSVQKLIYKTIGKLIPSWMTPNMITVMGALGGLAGIICAALSGINRFFLIGTICGLMCHLICDDLDGFVARKRNMTSKAGGYLDLLTDILHITYLLIAMSFAGVIRFETAIFFVPVYALIIFTATNYILYLKEFLFPRLGPIETHMFFIVICIAGMIFENKPIDILGFSMKITDIILLVGGIPMYFEMLRLQLKLFRTLSKKDKEEKNDDGKNE